MFFGAASVFARRGLVAAMFASVPAQETAPVSPSLFADMKWRDIGPHRGGRTVAVAGHRRQPYTFYIGVCNGGVWKTTDAGRTWMPIFDDQPTGSIGAIAVAPSDPEHRLRRQRRRAARGPTSRPATASTSPPTPARRGRTSGCATRQQIPHIDVDPRNPNRLFVAVLGHPYGPNEERGIFRSTDGGKTFQKVLYKDENTGGNDVDIDPVDPDIVYATLWEARQGPWENAAWAGTGGGIFKSTDGGTTWKQLTNGLPEASCRPNIAIAPSEPEAAVRDGGLCSRARRRGRRASTDRTTRARRGRASPPTRAPPAASAAATCRAHRRPEEPGHASIMAGTVTWKSTDGGKTWAAFKGAPGGDDYQSGWINPNNPDIILLVADQGAVITLNGGQSWSSWYNQPTAQLYHVTADNAFPYRVCSGQQESGSACVASRGNDGADHLPRLAPGGRGGIRLRRARSARPRHRLRRASVTRYDRRTGQVSNIGPSGRTRGARPAGTFRTVRTSRWCSRTVDPHALFYANNTCGRRWTAAALDADQPRPDAEDVGRAGERRQVPRQRAAKPQPARRHLHRGAVATATSTASGSAPTTALIHDDGGRRPALERRDTAAASSRGRRFRSSTPGTSIR